MIKEQVNNVFILKNGLENALPFLSIQDPLINFVTIDSDNFKEFDISDFNKVKENNIIIIKYGMLNEDNKKLLTKYFINNFNFSFPYILFLSDYELTENEERQIHLEDSFYYLMPKNEDKNYKIHFKLFIKTLFSKLHHIGRINSYIIDAFQTIVNAQIIEEQKNEIMVLNSELSKLSKTDYLTNLFNRRAFFDMLESEKKRTLREHWRIHNSDSIGSPEKQDGVISLKLKSMHKPHGCFFDHYGNFSCIIIDIDHFKMINDTYGHLKGDEVLKRLGSVLSENDIFRENDIIARYGGEEFVIMLPETNTFHARIPAERLRKKVKTIEFFSEDNKPFKITISAGISEFKITDTSNEDIINRADQALYYAKENGRDRVVVYDEI